MPNRDTELATGAPKACLVVIAVRSCHGRGTPQHSQGCTFDAFDAFEVREGRVTGRDCALSAGETKKLLRLFLPRVRTSLSKTWASPVICFLTTALLIVDMFFFVYAGQLKKIPEPCSVGMMQPRVRQSKATGYGYIEPEVYCVAPRLQVCIVVLQFTRGSALISSNQGNRGRL